MKKFKQLKEDLLKETTLNRIIQHSNDETYPISIITASQYKDSNNKDVLKKENIRNNNELQNELHKARSDKKIQGFVNIDGFWKYKDGTVIKDYSFFVIGNKNDDGELLKLSSDLGKKYNQEAILYRPKETNIAILIDLSNNETMRLGPIRIDKASEVFSKLRGRNGIFVFNED